MNISKESAAAIIGEFESVKIFEEAFVEYYCIFTIDNLQALQLIIDKIPARLISAGGLVPCYVIHDAILDPLHELVAGV